VSPRLAAVLVAFTVFLILAPIASADWDGLPECTPAGPRPCVASVERNGSAVGPSDPSFAFWSDHWVDPDGTNRYNFWVNNGTSSLSTSDSWEIVLNTGAVFPEQTFSRSQNMTIDRGTTGSGDHTVRFKVTPVRVSYGSCDSSGSCPMVNPNPTVPAYLDGWVDDAAYFTDPLDRAAIRGFDLASNTDWVSTPLQLDWATNTIILDVANSHFENDGTTVFQGHAEFKLPNAMLTRFYNVDDPATLTAAAFAVTGAGGAATSSVTVNPGNVNVVIDGITFSKRKLKIRGHTEPLRPRNLSAERKTETRGVIRSSGARARGSKVRGYQAVCRPGSGANVRAETTQQDPLPIHVRGLTQGKRYECTVRAKSRAGLGVPGTVTMPRRPG
jgi:Fibronectin type III domain